ncbi:MAG: hypothetical protein ABGW77_00515 [Campylobacterales bacterium]
MKRDSEIWPRFREFGRNILLAQVASDAGKLRFNRIGSNTKNAVREGYFKKAQYIHQAISHGKKLPKGLVKIGISKDEKGIPVVLFDIKGYGQVSFHLPELDFENPKYDRYRDRVKWNGSRISSIKTCEKLARKLQFPYYRKK